jgi:hypothetical protein
MCVCPEKNFGVCPKQNFFGDPPPARQQFWGKIKILMLSLPVWANYTVPPKQDDAHTPMSKEYLKFNCL